MKAFALVIVGIAAVAAVAAIYMGAFHSIAITEENRGPFTLVYRDMAAGRMSDVGDITTALDGVLESRGIAQRKPLDVFFPDGRGEIGFAVEGVSGEQLGALRDAASVKVIGAQRYLVANFPWRNRLSFLVGFMKVDPALARYRDAHGYKKVEAIALNDGDTIVYLQPVVRL
jgi:hypothetical protein